MSIGALIGSSSINEWGLMAKGVKNIRTIPAKVQLKPNGIILINIKSQDIFCKTTP